MHPLKIASFEGFGFRELDMAADLLKAIANNPAPKGFDKNQDLSIGFNPESTLVFLTNEDYQACVFVNGKLAVHYTTPDECIEGTLEELISCYKNMTGQDQEYVRQIAQEAGVSVPKKYMS